MVNSAHRPWVLKRERTISLQPLLELASATEAHPLPKPVYLLKELIQNEKKKKLEFFYAICFLRNEDVAF